MRHLLHIVPVGIALVAALAAGCGAEETSTGGGAGGTGSGGGDGGGVPAECSDLLGAELAPGTAPQERGDMASAYDPVCKRTFMFFGDAALPENCGPSPSVLLSDGYVYDSAAGIWTNIDVSGPQPLPRARSRAVWDEASRRVILFGGRYRDGTVGPYTFLNDVWAFDPVTRAWTELSPQGAAGPSGRMNHTMDADPANNRFIVHAGGTVASDVMSFTVNNETWAFDLGTNSWSQIGATNPPLARLFHMSALDRANNRLVIFSGGDAGAFQGPFLIDTWSLDLTTDVWTPHDSPAVPPARIKGEMVWDAERNRVVLFAGHDGTLLGNTNDLWTFDLTTNAWSLVTYGDTLDEGDNGFCNFPAHFATYDETSPERRESHLFQSAGDKAILYGGRTDCGLTKDTWELDYATLVWTKKNDSPVGITCLRSGSPTCVQTDNMCL